MNVHEKGQFVLSLTQHVEDAAISSLFVSTVTANLPVQAEREFSSADKNCQPRPLPSRGLRVTVPLSP